MSDEGTALGIKAVDLRVVAVRKELRGEGLGVGGNAVGVAACGDGGGIEGRRRDREDWRGWGDEIFPVDIRDDREVRQEVFPADSWGDGWQLRDEVFPVEVRDFGQLGQEVFPVEGAAGERRERRERREVAARERRERREVAAGERREVAAGERETAWEGLVGIEGGHG